MTRPTKEQVSERERILGLEVRALREVIDKYVGIVGVNGVEFYSLENQLTELREAAEACVRDLWDIDPGDPIVAAPVEPHGKLERLAWVLAKDKP